MRWLKYRTGTWHAWRDGETGSVCQQLTVLDLLQHPALDVSNRPPPVDQPRSGLACQKCSKLLGVQLETPEEIAAAWAGKIRMLCARMRVKLAKQDVEDFADHLTRVGSVRDPEAVETFHQIASLLIKPARRHRGGQTWNTVPGFHEALAKIPPRRDVLLGLAHAVRLWRRVARKDPAQDTYRPDRVVQGFLEVAASDPEAYITRLVAKGFSQIGTAFHPNTVEAAKKDPGLRGLFWTGQKSSQEILDGVEVLGEEEP